MDRRRRPWRADRRRASPGEVTRLPTPEREDWLDAGSSEPISPDTAARPPDRDHRKRPDGRPLPGLLPEPAPSPSVVDIDAARRNPHLRARKSRFGGLPLEDLLADAVHRHSLVTLGHRGEQANNIYIVVSPDRLECPGAVFPGAPGDQPLWLRHARLSQSVSAEPLRLFSYRAITKSASERRLRYGMT